MVKIKEEKVKLGENVEIPKKEFCDRCGNDLIKGSSYLHFPFIKMYIALCHICLNGLLYGFYKDVCRELKELKYG